MHPNGTTALSSSINCIFVAFENKSIGIIGSILLDTWPYVCYLSIALLSYNCSQFAVGGDAYTLYTVYGVHEMVIEIIFIYKYVVNELRTMRNKLRAGIRTPISCSCSFAHFQIKDRKKRIITSESSVHNFALSYMVYHTHAEEMLPLHEFWSFFHRNLDLQLSIIEYFWVY